MGMTHLSAGRSLEPGHAVCTYTVALNKKQCMPVVRKVKASALRLNPILVISV